MKTFKLSLAIIVLNLLGIGCMSEVIKASENKQNVFFTVENYLSASDSTEYDSENRPFSGMFFSTDYVVEEFEYDDAFCIIYNDPDANMDNVAIFVEAATFKAICETIENGEKMVGSLTLNEGAAHDGFELYYFIEEPEFEMAEASANF